MDSWLHVSTLACALSAWTYVRPTPVPDLLGIAFGIIMCIDSFVVIVVSAIRMGQEKPTPSVQAFWGFIGACALLFFPTFVWWLYAMARRAPNLEEVELKAAQEYGIQKSLTRKVFMARGGSFPFEQVKLIFHSIGEYEERRANVRLFLLKQLDPREHYEISEAA